MDLFGELEWRGLVYDATDGVRDVLAREKVTGYIGFDPTSASLHVGNLLQMMALAHLQRHGHSPIAVVGGGTGLIGDPSGKSVERQLMSVDEVDANVAGIRAQLARFLAFDSTAASARVVNNADWLAKLSAVDFMRDVGKHFTVNAMLAKESVRRRIESEDGITYTEFSYSLLQAYDFLELYDRFGCTLQMGGSDQWGNITAGMDLIRRLRAGKAHGLVTPLITTASGAKFGKTESGAIWLDPVRTIPYKFHQFWFHTEDRDVIRYLKFFTFLDAATIADLERAVAEAPDKREAQRALARDVTRRVHGETAVTDAEAAAALMFSGDFLSMRLSVLLPILDDVPSKVIPHQLDGWRVSALLVAAQLAKSNTDAANLIRGGAVSVNGHRVTDEKARLHSDDAIEGQVFFIEKGKKDKALIRISA